MPELFTGEFEFAQKPRGGRPPQERSAERQEFDGAVQAAYDSGKALVYVVKADDAELKALSANVRNSANHLGYGLQTGDLRPGPRKGTVYASWRVVVRTKRTRKPKETPAE